MEIAIEENIKMVNFMEKEDIFGQMAVATKDSLKKASAMDKEAGNLHKIMAICT